MEATLFGQVNRPVAAIIGVWDPFLTAHHELFGQLVGEAHQRGYSPLAILIEPSPQLVMYGSSQWPVYHDFQSRRELMFSYGLDAIMQLHFRPQDFKAQATDFFEAAFSLVPLAELWLGHSQRLGTGPGGSVETVTNLAEQYGLWVKRLPDKNLDNVSREVRNLLIAGRVKEAKELVGRPPVLSRPENGRVEVGWKPGNYQAVAVQNPVEPVSEGSAIDLTLKLGPEKERYFEWPAQQIEYLAFTAGPGDRGEV